MLRVERATVYAPGGTHEAVRDLSLGVVPGEILALVGPNGSGKSTTLAALAGVLRPVRGRVTLGGRDVHRYGRRALAQRIARLPQEPACPEGLTLEQVVRFGRHSRSSPLGSRDPEASSVVARSLDEVGLLDARQRPMAGLSGGERRRGWLAMVLAQEAEILLLDEPTAALDVRHQIEVLDVVRRLGRHLHRTVVLVLHDLTHAIRIADRVAVLHRGRLYRVGPPRECIDGETLRDVFGVRGELRLHPDEPRLAILGLAAARRRL